MNLPGRFFLAVLSSLPIPCGQFFAVIPRQPEVLFINCVFQKTEHGIATFDTQNHWIKFEALADDVLLTVDVHQVANADTDLGLPTVMESLNYRLHSSGDAVSHSLPTKERKGTIVSLETYDQSFNHYQYVFSY